MISYPLFTLLPSLPLTTSNGAILVQFRRVNSEEHGTKGETVRSSPVNLDGQDSTTSVYRTISSLLQSTVVASSLFVTQVQNSFCKMLSIYNSDIFCKIIVFFCSSPIFERKSVISIKNHSWMQSFGCRASYVRLWIQSFGCRALDVEL